MASVQDRTESSEDKRVRPVNSESLAFLRPLASLKLSVVLFALGIFLVLAGTLAQSHKDIWDVVHGYFRCWMAWIEFQVFFPKSWAPQFQDVKGGFWFPGGWTIGGLMTLNLLAAHALRFKVQAKGSRLLWGSVVTLIGIALTWAVIVFGTERDSVYETASIDWSKYWNLMCFSLFIPAIGCGIAASKHAGDAAKKVEFYTYSILSLLFLGTGCFLVAGGESVRLDNSSMRILWQLIQATFAGGVLLGGCLLLFKKRAGIVLLHAGVLMIMANEVVVYSLHEEGNMILFEGETTNFVQDIRSTELAVVDRSAADKDVQTVVPSSLLKNRAGNEELLRNEQLPFALRVREFHQNADLKPRKEGDENPADFGLGKTHTIEPLAGTTGTDSNADYPAAYVDVVDSESGETIHTLLVSALASAVERQDTIEIGDRSYEVSLRFKRVYKPYSMHLIDVRKDDYVGTNTPRNYSSEVRLVDKTRNEDRKIRIWMNNPLRFAGETFYQSGFNQLPRGEMTTLQVVTNEGWMIPYLACMIVAIGMLYQFGVSLMRFLNRLATGKIGGHALDTPESIKEFDPVGFAFNVVPAVLLLGVCGYWLLSLAKVPQATGEEFNYYEFGKIPVVYEGRVKPIDTLVRNTLRITSNRETIRMEEKEATDDTPAQEAETLDGTQWFLEMIAGSRKALQRPIVKIDNDELLSTLGLERRKSHRYTLGELQPKLAELTAATREARELNEKSPGSLSVYQRKVLEFERKFGAIDILAAAFISPQIDIEGENVTEQFMTALARARQLDERQPPLLVPPVEESMGPDDESLKRDEWETYSKAFLNDIIYPTAFQAEANPFSGKFTEIINAYQEGDATTFNKKVREYQSMLKTEKVADVDMTRVAFETRFNSFAPFFYPGFLYILAFVIAVASWLMPRTILPANWAAVGLIGLTFAVHTWAIWARMEISGRPPVTNLYSSAVFIGWAGVLFGIVMEFIFKRGIGNVLASAAGFASLWIAHGLAGDGDTFVVLQAVLDTQFWLSTHVVCVTLGYAATFVAGALGIIYICRRNPIALLGVCGAVAAAIGLQGTEIPVLVRNIGPFLLAIPVSLIPMHFLFGAPQVSLSEGMEKALARMIYGTLCFALWFSFVGTVLGGLWADDSWGRFWGWDPKENGALIIVLWNALVLHARWDRMIGSRGLAVLAVAGNITTAWSWFGVNELGVGLHSYGFTEGVLFNLMLFVFSQLTLIVIGLWGKPADENTPKAEPQTLADST